MLLKSIEHPLICPVENPPGNSGKLSQSRPV